MGFFSKLQNGAHAFSSAATKTTLQMIESKHPNLSSSDERFIREVRQAINNGEDLRMYQPQIRALADQCKR